MEITGGDCRWRLPAEVACGNCVSLDKRTGERRVRGGVGSVWFDVMVSAGD